MEKLNCICPNCGFSGCTKTITKGSFSVELILWLFFLLPGVIYSVWRLASRYEGCPSCGAANLVPVNSPRGKQLLSEGK